MSGVSQNQQKPASHSEADKLGWRLTHSNIHFDNEVMRLREDCLEVPKTGPQRFAYVEQGAAVMIVPLTKDGQIVTIQQYRYPVDEFCLEVPAGKTGDVPGLSLEEVAGKELAEEVGGRASRLEHLSASFTNPSLSDEECHYFLAHDVCLDQPKAPEPMEAIEIRLLPAAEAVRLARNGGFRTGPAALALLLAEPRLRELGWM